MIGHQPLIQMRLAGYSPPAVYIEDHPSLTHEDWHIYGELPCVNVHNYPLSNVDLRFAIGLIVNITSFSTERAKTLFFLAKESKARVITSGVIKPGPRHFKQDGWFDIYMEKL